MSHLRHVNLSAPPKFPKQTPHDDFARNFQLAGFLNSHHQTDSFVHSQIQRHCEADLSQSISRARKQSTYIPVAEKDLLLNEKRSSFDLAKVKRSVSQKLLFSERPLNCIADAPPLFRNRNAKPWAEPREAPANQYQPTRQRALKPPQNQRTHAQPNAKSHSQSQPSDEQSGQKRKFAFMSASDKHDKDEKDKGNYGKSLGGKRRTSKRNHLHGSTGGGQNNMPSYVKKAIEDDVGGSGDDGEKGLPDRLKGCDPKLVETIQNEIMDRNPQVRWEDIIGLEFQKKSVQEIVVWPMLRPDIFTGLRGPPKGILLFGPPGTGKTLIGKAIASEAGAKFFSISASSLTSKWHGEGEKLVKTLFAVAGLESPAIIFIDEIDSLLSQRSSSEFEASRRIKTEFLVQLDGAHTNPDERVLLIGATNRPQELDEAARRRLIKRLYIPLPSAKARLALLKHLVRNERNNITEDQFNDIRDKTDGYSGADIKALCTEAAFGPIRDCPNIRDIDSSRVNPINYSHFTAAVRQVRASVSSADLQQYVDWDQMYGSFAEASEPDIASSET